MNPPNIYYSAILMATGVACLVVAIMVWYMRRGAAGARPLFIYLLALSWWDITYAIFWTDFPSPTPYFWLDITLVGAFVVPTTFLIFTLEYARLQKWLMRPFIYALLIEPVITFIALWTDPWHDLFFGGKRALSTTRIPDGGPVFWTNIYYSYSLILIGIVILFVVYFRSVGIYRKQTGMILAAFIIPWMVHIAFLATGGILPDADITPFIFSVSALIIAFALVTYRLLDIVPIAHSMLIENMSEGVVVLDTQNRVVDINPAALDVTNSSAAASIGEPVEKVFSHWTELITQFNDINQASVEVTVGAGVLDLRVSPLLDKRSRLVGRLIVWRDITDLKATQSKLEKLATTDVLTQTLNRRSFLERATAELNRAERLGSPLSIALMDIDDFKHINDTYGHPAGDQVLVKFAETCTSNIREFDTFARFGGEEFALLMPDTNSEQALQVCERLRLRVLQQEIDLGEQAIFITLSFGITDCLDRCNTLDYILYQADQALYTAKQSGKNQVVVWQDSMDGKR